MSVPYPEVVLTRLANLIPTVYSALQHGTFKAKEYCEQYETDGAIDPFLAPNLVRFHAKKLLQQKGHFVRDEEVSLDNIPNNGLCLSYRDYKIRILKASNGDLPVPGHSRSRQLFYHQIPMKLTDENEITKLNLVLLWDVTSQYDLTELCLVCPRSGGETRESVNAHWSYPIPQSVLMGESPHPITNETYVIEDLPILLKRQDKTGTEDAIG